MSTYEEEFLTQGFELLGMTRSDAQGKLEAMTMDKKMELLGELKNAIRNGV